MKTVWKYELRPLQRQAVPMPDGAHVLAVGVQRNRLCVWAEVETTHPLAPRDFLIVGTGIEITLPHEHLWHCGVALLDDGDLVLHVYEVRP